MAVTGGWPGALIGDFLKALGQMTDRRFLGVFAISVGLTVLLLVGLAVVAGWLVTFLPATVALPWVGEVSVPETGLQGLAVLGVLGASVFLMIPVSVIFVNLFLDRIVKAVEAKYYPDIGAVREPGIWESVRSAAAFTGIVVMANAVGLVLYLVTGPLGPLIFLGINGYLLGREFFETVAQRYMEPLAAQRLRRRFRGRTWVAGVLMTIPLTVPVLNLVIPVLGVATFTHQVIRLKRQVGG